MLTRLCLLILLLLAACTSAGTETPEATLQVITIARTPALQPLTEALLVCADTLPDVRLQIVEVPAYALTDRDADLYLRLGEPEPPSAFSAPLAWEQVVLAVHPANPLDELSVEQAAAIFAGQVARWEEVGGEEGEIHPWVALEGEDWVGVFEAGIGLGELISTHAGLAPGPASMLEAVSADELAIGYLPLAWATEAVKIISLDLYVPVLALANAEPDGVSRALLACLQGEVGQNALGEVYIPWEER